MHTALSLHKLQSEFARWMLGEQAAVLAETVSGNGLAPEARLQIYRNIVFNNLTAALSTAYPAVLKLVGEEFFDGAAARYIRDYPSVSGNLQDFGAQFAECLGSISETATLPYLADVAQLEWARQQAYLAADAAPLEPGALTTVADDKQNDLRLALHPSVHLFESNYPVLDIWGFCQRDTDERLTLGDTGQLVLIWRTDIQISMQALTKAQYAFSDSLMKQDTLGSAQAHALDLGTDFDVSIFLRWLFSEKLITGYSVA